MGVQRFSCDAHFGGFVKAFGLASALTLSACAQTPPPAIQVQPVTVDIPIPARCIDPAKVPARPARAQFNGDAVHDVSAAEIELTTYRNALDMALALIGPCEVVPAGEK